MAVTSIPPHPEGVPDVPPFDEALSRIAKETADLETSYKEALIELIGYGHAVVIHDLLPRDHPPPSWSKPRSG